MGIYRSRTLHPEVKIMDRTALTERVLLIYSGVLTGVLSMVLGSGSAAPQKDPQGRDRIVMAVSADGNPSLQFLDDQGKVTAHFPKEAR
jgi:hypothetical protein